MKLLIEIPDEVVKDAFSPPTPEGVAETLHLVITEECMLDEEEVKISPLEVQ